jgi:DNA-directed RNA polymerase subunit RPC12/RpoP
MSVTVCPHCRKPLSDDDAEGIYCEHCGGNILRPPTDHQDDDTSKETT